MNVIFHSKSNNEIIMSKFLFKTNKPMAKQIIFNQKSDTSLNDESSNEVDFGVFDNESLCTPETARVNFGLL